MSIKDTFWDHVTKTESCWMWTRSTNSNGYGIFRSWPDNKCIMAHRYSYESEYGPIPHGLFVCHKCDTPKCVNPSHLFVGTQNDNMRDAQRKGRMRLPAPRHGMLNHNAKMTPERVRELRALARRDYNIRALSRRFQVSRATVRSIVSGATWSHVEGC